jgi:ribosomal protein S19E (S16A)
MSVIKGPDFQTEGISLGMEGIKQAYKTGRGKITLRAETDIEEMSGNRQRIIVSSLPYQVNKANLIKAISDLSKEKKIEELRSSVKQYIEELKEMIKLRTGKEFELWLMPQLRVTAQNMVLLDRIQEQIAIEDDLTTSMTGSMGQQKIDVNPLLLQSDKCQRTLLQQFEALGLNYNTAKGKVASNGGSASDNPAANDDPVLAALLNK